MLNFIYQYGWMIVALVFAGLYFYELYKKQGKAAALEQLRLAAFKLMVLAEKQFGKGNGEFKFTWVVDKLYALLPDTAKVFISRDLAEKYVQKWYDELKDYLDDGQVNESIPENQSVTAVVPSSDQKDNSTIENPEQAQTVIPEDTNIQR